MALNRQAIGRHIRELRKKRNMSQDKLSELIDKSPTYMSYIECGTKNMSLDTFVRIANVLGTSADLLLVENLSRVPIAASREITELLSECTDLERNILVCILKASKAALRESLHRKQ